MPDDAPAVRIKAAGVLYLTQRDEALFLKRSDDSDHPGEWCFPGGRIEDDETAEQAARREASEELGDAPRGEMRELMRDVSDGVYFTTFAQRVLEPFPPILNGEHTGWAWAKVSAPPEPLHPGSRKALARLGMNELHVARAMRDGEMTSPQRYEKLWLFAIRITGTGVSYRPGLKEFVHRDKADYLNDEFLARCAGLPVVWEHPDKLTLDSESYADQVIGAVMLPYLKGDEVWGIAKIHDDDAATRMAASQLSTSPGVFFRNASSINSKVKLPDGETLLIEGDPSLLDHIAVCSLGVWDKGGPPAGVLNDVVERADSMTDEEKARADAAARADADAGKKLDQLLSGLDSLRASVDSVKTRMDTFDEKEKARDDSAKADAARADAARKDRASRMDAEHEGWMKADEAACKTDDAEEFAEKKKLMEEGEPEEVAADKARSSRKDRMTARADKARKDSEDGEEEERRKKKEAEEAKNDAARADSASTARELADVRAKLAALEAITRPIPEADRQPYVDEQVRADAVYQAFGQRAPSPLGGETVNLYRLRLARGVQRYSPRWSKADLNVMMADQSSFGVAQDQIYADAVISSRTPDGLEPGQLLARVHVNPETGQRTTTFTGHGTFIGQMRRAPRRARIINSNARGA